MKNNYKKPFSTLAFLITLALVFCTNNKAQAQVLFNNGPVFNSAGTGSGGADESILWTTTFSMSTIGSGHQLSALNRVADDFSPTGCGWIIDSIAFFAYQTNSPITSTINHVNLRIWDSIPGVSGSNIVFGDTTTNRMNRTSWSGVYRITETTSGSTARPIMRQVVNVGDTLAPGTFWLDWQSGGTLTSGPWAPPIADTTATTGNARQKVSGNTYNPLLDGGSNTPQGLPFVIYGRPAGHTVDAGANTSVCPGSVVTLGGSPTTSGAVGTPTYSWTPSTGLSSTTVANPTVTASITTTYYVTVTDPGTGCSNTDSIVVTVGSISSSFLGSDTTICLNGSLTLNAGSATSYNWSTGATSQTISAGPGTYSVVRTDAQGCSSNDTITISAYPGVSITGTTSFCNGASTTLSSSITGTTYTWSTGGSAATEVVSTAGMVSLTVIDGNGCTTSDTVTTSIIPAPSASFTASPNGLTVNFTDGSTGSPTSWSWNFGDGNTSTLQNPSHTYSMDSTYTVTLIVMNSCGSDTFTSTTTVVNISADIHDVLVNVFPNPAQQQFDWELSGFHGKSIVIELMNSQGQIVYQSRETQSKNSQKGTINVSEMSRGIYYLRIISDRQQSLHKVILE